MTPLPQRSAEIKVEWLGGDWPWVSCKLSPVFSPPGWLLTDYDSGSQFSPAIRPFQWTALLYCLLSSPPWRAGSFTSNLADHSMTELFPASDIAAIQKFYQSYEPCRALDNYRGIAAAVGAVKNLFFGDSITAAWPLHEFFPQYSVLNRGIGGDNPVGLHTRLEQDVFQYSPQRVFMLVGINGIQAPQELIIARICHVAQAIRERGIAVYPGSILPLRSPDQWNRFQYQDKIVAINRELAAWSAAAGAPGSPRVATMPAQ